jgi:hypothetical protein
MLNLVQSKYNSSLYILVYKAVSCLYSHFQMFLWRGCQKEITIYPPPQSVIHLDNAVRSVRRLVYNQTYQPAKYLSF